jgi:hypothetical protein
MVPAWWFFTVCGLVVVVTVIFVLFARHAFHSHNETLLLFRGYQRASRERFDASEERYDRVFARFIETASELDWYRAKFGRPKVVVPRNIC